MGIAEIRACPCFRLWCLTFAQVHTEQGSLPSPSPFSMPHIAVLLCSCTSSTVSYTCCQVHALVSGLSQREDSLHLSHLVISIFPVNLGFPRAGYTVSCQRRTAEMMAGYAEGWSIFSCSCQKEGNGHTSAWFRSSAQTQSQAMVEYCKQEQLAYNAHIPTGSAMELQMSTRVIEQSWSKYHKLSEMGYLTTFVRILNP